MGVRRLFHRGVTCRTDGPSQRHGVAFARAQQWEVLYVGRLVAFRKKCLVFASCCLFDRAFVTVRRQMVAELNRAQLASGMAEKLKLHEERAR